MEEDPLHCPVCETDIDIDEATVCGTMGDLDPEKWQTLCCPHCGQRLKTVFIGEES
jgi:uncharacterized protein (UPF0212 family)